MVRNCVLKDVLKLTLINFKDRTVLFVSLANLSKFSRHYRAKLQLQLVANSLYVYFCEFGDLNLHVSLTENLFRHHPFYGTFTRHYLGLLVVPLFFCLLEHRTGGAGGCSSPQLVSSFYIHFYLTKNCAL